MKADADKTTTELISELNQLRVQLAERDQDVARERIDHKETVDALRMAQLIVDRSPAVLFRRKAGDDPRLVYISENFRHFGYEPEDFLTGKKAFRDIVYEADQERVHNEVMDLAEADLEEYSMYYRVVTGDGQVRWIEDQTSVVRDEAGNKTHNQGILIDITERKTAEEKLQKSEEKFRRIVETASEGFLLMNEDLTIVDVNNAYCRMLGYAREELLGKTPFDLASDESREYMQANREAILAQEVREFEGSLMAKDGRTVPVLIHGSTLRDDHGAVIGNMAFVTDMTEHKKALVLASEVQKSLLPENKPDVKGLDIAGRNVSCDEIGGDYYDFLWRHSSKQGAFSIIVGDISGHGVDSALLMTTARAFLRMRASQPGTLSEVITAMNNHLAQDVLDTGKFMTLFYLSIDPEQKHLGWVRAGHDPALVYDPEKDDFEELKGSGIALGVINEFEYLENSKEGLKDGQIIAIGTDGIWEACNRAGEMFGKKRFCNIIRKHAEHSADDILNAVYTELNSFTIGKRSEDDITLVIVKVDGIQ